MLTKPGASAKQNTATRRCDAPTTGATTVVANNEGHRFASYVADIMLAGDVPACCFVPSPASMMSAT